MFVSQSSNKCFRELKAITFCPQGIVALYIFSSKPAVAEGKDLLQFSEVFQCGCAGTRSLLAHAWKRCVVDRCPSWRQGL